MEKQSQRETSETDLVQPQPTCRFLFSSQGGALLRFGARLELDPIHVEGLGGTSWTSNGFISSLGI